MAEIRERPGLCRGSVREHGRGRLREGTAAPRPDPAGPGLREGAGPVLLAGRTALTRGRWGGGSRVC